MSNVTHVPKVRARASTRKQKQDDARRRVEDFVNDPSLEPRDLGERVAWAVAARFKGNTSQAAIAMGIPQPTLSRIALGKTLRPSAEVIDTISKGAAIPLQWLVSGEGPKNPRMRTQHTVPGFLLWRGMVASLGLTDATRELVERLPEATWAAAARAAWDFGAKSEEEMDERTRYLAMASYSREVEAWEWLIENLVAKYKREAVRDWLESRADDLRQRFSNIEQREAKARR